MTKKRTICPSARAFKKRVIASSVRCLPKRDRGKIRALRRKAASKWTAADCELATRALEGVEQKTICGFGSLAKLKAPAPPPEPEPEPEPEPVVERDVKPENEERPPKKFRWGAIPVGSTKAESPDIEEA